MSHRWQRLGRITFPAGEVHVYVTGLFRHWHFMICDLCDLRSHATRDPGVTWRVARIHANLHAGAPLGMVPWPHVRPYFW